MMLTKRKAENPNFTGSENKILAEFEKSKAKRAKLETKTEKKDKDSKLKNSLLKVKRNTQIPDDSLIPKNRSITTKKGKDSKLQKRLPKVKKSAGIPNESKIPKNANTLGKKKLIKYGTKKKKSLPNGQKPDDVDWKEFKKVQKKLKEKRKEGSEPSRYQLSVKAKEVWEELRRDDTPEAKKAALCSNLYSTLRGNFNELIFAHDTVRVVECIVASAPLPIKQAVFDELKNNLMLIVKSKYAHFYILKVLRYGTKEQRQNVIQMFRGHVVSLLRHKIGSKVLETAYNDWANANERAEICQEFYGPEFKIFKEEGIYTLNDAVAKHPDKKVAFLNYLKEALEPVIEKGLFQHSVVHRLLFEYLSMCGEKEKEELIQSLRGACVEMLHTRDGARITMICLWHGTTKDRKAIGKSFKTHVPKICMEEHGYMALLALFDCMDDTVFVAKAILSEISSNIKEIAFHEHGRKVIMYLLAGRDTRYTHPQVIDILKQGDNNVHSKKELGVRHRELRDAISPSLLNSVVEDVEEWFSTNANILVLLDILEHCNGDLKPVHEAIAKTVCSLEKVEDKDKNQVLPVEHTGAHFLMKKLMQLDKKRHESGLSNLFTSTLLDQLTADVISTWISTNRGAFTLVLMLETEIPTIKDELGEKLATFKKALKKESTKGATVLLSKLSK